MILNDRDLIVVHASMQKKKNDDGQSEILSIDLHSLNSWKRIKLREDMRAMSLINFGIIPFVKEDQVRECIMMLGGTQSTTQTFVWDEKSPEVVRTAIFTDCRDRFLTQCFHKSIGREGSA